MKPVTKQMFGRASPGAAREAAPSEEPEPELFLEEPEPCQTGPKLRQLKSYMLCMIKKGEMNNLLAIVVLVNR